MICFGFLDCSPVFDILGHELGFWGVYFNIGGSVFWYLVVFGISGCVFGF